MTGKKVAFKKKPTIEEADTWVEQREIVTDNTAAAKPEPVEETAPPESMPPPEPNRRLTIDLPDSLHREVKLHAVKNRETMANFVRRVLEAELAKGSEGK